MMATLLVNDTTPRIQYTATASQTVFAYPFAIFADADLKVYQTLSGATADDSADLLTLTTHYTVSGAASTDGGNVTLVTGASAGDIITIERDLAVERTSDYTDNGEFLAETFNDDFDKLVMMVQQQEDKLDNKSLLLQSSSTFSGSLALPEPEASKFLAWNSGGTALENTAGLAGPTGPQGPAGAGLYSAVDPAITPALDDKVSLTDTDNADAASSATVQKILDSAGILATLTPSSIDVDADYVLLYDATGTAAVKVLASAIVDKGVPGLITVPGTASNGAEIRLAEDTDNGTNYMGLKAPASTTASVTLILPDGDGSADQVLKTDGSGNLGWVSNAVSDGSVTRAKLATTTVSAAGTINAGANLLLTLQAYAFFPMIHAADAGVRLIVHTTDGASADSPRFGMHNPGTGPQTYDMDYRYITA